MNKEELVREISIKATKELGVQITPAIAKACLNGFINVVQAQTKRRKPVVLVGFGTFDTADRAGRTGRNPRTKEAIEIPAKVVPVFKPGSDLKATTANLKVRKSRLSVQPVAVEEEPKQETKAPGTKKVVKPAQA